MGNHSEKMSRKPRLLAWFAFGTLGLATALIVLVSFWLFYPYKTIDQTPQPFKIIYPPEYANEHTIPQGGYFSYKFAYKKYVDIDPVIHRQFVDGLVFNVGDTYPTVINKGTGVAHVQVYVPRTLPPGRYRLRITTEYKMNPVRTIVNERYTEYFLVTASHDIDKD